MWRENAPLLVRFRNQRGPGDAPNSLLENTKFNLNVNIGRPVFRKDEHEKRETTERWDPCRSPTSANFSPYFFSLSFLSFFSNYESIERSVDRRNESPSGNFFMASRWIDGWGWIREREIIRSFSLTFLLPLFLPDVSSKMGKRSWWPRISVDSSWIRAQSS